MLVAACALAPGLASQEAAAPRAIEIDSGRFSFIAYPRDEGLARALLREALAHDTFPGLPRPRAHAQIVVTPDARHFREAVGPSAPEWGAAIAIPERGRIVMQGSSANTSAGDPSETLRHELAHLALYEALGELPPRWFDEGYASFAAGERSRDDVLATNIALVFRGVPPLDSLDAFFEHGEAQAQTGYALARRAVADISALDPVRGLSLFFQYWRATRSMDQALRRAYGVTEAGFELKWRAGTRRRYGALAMFADLSLAIVLLLAVVLPLWLMRRRRDRRRMAALRAADELQERRERRAALQAMLDGGAEGPWPPGEGGAGPGNENLIN